MANKLSPLEARVELINGLFDLPSESSEAMKQIRAIVATCAQDLKVVFDSLTKSKEAGSPPPGYDMGRAIAAIDLLQQVKDVACVSILLPHASSS